MKNDWVRVSKKVRCSICFSGDWCTFTADGRFACCMRQHQGCLRTLRNGGYLFRLSDERPRHTAPRPAAQPVATVDFPALAARAERELTDTRAEHFADALRLPAWSLRAVHCGWYNGTLGFPMYDAAGTVIGVRLRHEDGTKLCIRGSHNGLFLVEDTIGRLDVPLCFVVEGGTNLAALTAIGLWGVGRPCNTGGLDLLVAWLATQPGEPVIIRDNDTKPAALENTLHGVAALTARLHAIHRPVRVITTPTKDVRDWVRAGAEAPAVLGLVKAAKKLERA